MIDFIKGVISEITDEAVIIDKNGIGIKIMMPSSALDNLSQGEDRTIYTDLVVREDDISLYGFDSLHQRQMYLLLRTVSGIGPKVAMNILGGMDSNILQKSILVEDLTVLTQAPGVGKKTAQRIIVELKDKLSNLGFDESLDLKEMPQESMGNPAMEALMQLGYQKSEAEKMLRNIDQSQPIEKVLRQALKNR